MNIITSSEMYAPRPEIMAQPNGQKPDHMHQSGTFQVPLDQNVLEPGDCRGCHGVSNDVDLDAFFEAWGTDNSTYDVDGNGIVDGGDLTILLANQSETPMPGSVDDVLEQWGIEGDSSADLNGDGVVDGEDLVLALAGDEGTAASEEVEYATKLEALLADWGTDNVRSDFNGDGFVDGADLSILLGGGPDSTQNSESVAVTKESPTLSLNGPGIVHDAVDAFSQASAREGTREISEKVVAHLKNLGFESEPPSNIMELIHAFKMNPTNSRGLLANIVDLFGGRDGSTLAHG